MREAWRMAWTSLKKEIRWYRRTSWSERWDHFWRTPKGPPWWGG